MNNTAKVGDKIHAVYVVNGREQNWVDLGTVTKIEKKNKCFYDGNKVKRGYTFSVRNGVKILGFTTPEKEPTKEETKEA